jgi:heat shock protein HslJ
MGMDQISSVLIREIRGSIPTCWGSLSLRQLFFNMNTRSLLKRLPMLAALLLLTCASVAQAAVASRGTITAVTPAGAGNNNRASIFITGPREADTQNEEAMFFVTATTQLFKLEGGKRVVATFADLKVGQRAEASYVPGPMIMIYPPQGAASEIVILAASSAPPAAPVSPAAPTAPAAAVPKDMADTDWTLASWAGADGTAVAASGVTLRFGADGRASGRAPVNSYFGNVKIAADGVVAWAGGFGSTRMAGPPERMQLETRYLAELAKTSKATLTEGKLLLTGEGRLRFEFARAPRS